MDTDYAGLVESLVIIAPAYAAAMRESAAAFLFTPQGYGALVAVLLLSAWALYVRLRPRRFYFVRHGKSLLNAAHIRQSADGALAPEGREQAQRTGVFLAQFPIQIIYSSPYERAAETAAIISTHLQKSVRYRLLLAERRNPREIIGRSADDPEVKKIIDHIDLSYHPDAARYSDEENFDDLKRRARKCLRFLSHVRQTQACVVTHGIFLRMLLAYMIYGRDLNAREYVKVSFFNPADNANIMICDYRPWRRFLRGNGWDIVTYNLQAPRSIASPEKPPAEVMPKDPTSATA